MATRLTPHADLTLILEGTYPYVPGGVSAWVDTIIRGLPEIRFAVIFLGSRRQDYGNRAYALHDNVKHYEEHFLFEDPPPPPQSVRVPAEARERFRELHTQLERDWQERRCPFATTLTDLLSRATLFNEIAFFFSQASWDFIVESYHRRSTDPSFIDYFWTVRSLHRPIWRLLDIARRLPPTPAYHSVSTGYAGFLGTLLQRGDRLPFVLMEHGIYTKERRIDLLAADWIHDNANPFQRNPGTASHLREIWVRFFEILGYQTYASADPIISLYRGARQRQIEDGAPLERTHIVPNGVAVEKFRPLRTQRSDPPPPVLCFLGRVVPIKDVKTFIRAARVVINQMPEAQAWIVGPTDEDPAYFEECRRLVTTLALKDQVRFLGYRRPQEIFPQVGLLVLSSISEGLPLVVLEGFASGLPCVATDVGACRELIEGRDAEDRRLGQAGRIVGIANPQALAQAALELLGDRECWQRASRVAIRRVESYYTESQMLDRFRRIYQGAIENGRHRLRTA